MGYDNFKTFFDKSIKQYHPYSTNLFYSTLTSFLLDPFFKEAYSIIPEKFINLFEEQIISSEIYDSILISLGYPESLISSISVSHKEVILNKFTNYYKYKTTLNHFKEICSTFNESINLYELYITKKNNDYFFTPKSIYEDTSYDVIDLDYETVYNSVENYFISKELIINYDNNMSIAFPIKTNLLYFILFEGLDCDSSITYKLINFFKPYHTGIYIDRISKSIFPNIVYRSNVDDITLKDNFKLGTKSPHYTSYTIGDSFILKLDGNEVIL